MDHLFSVSFSLARRCLRYFSPMRQYWKEPNLIFAAFCGTKDELRIQDAIQEEGLRIIDLLKV